MEQLGDLARAQNVGGCKWRECSSGRLHAHTSRTSRALIKGGCPGGHHLESRATCWLRKPIPGRASCRSSRRVRSRSPAPDGSDAPLHGVDCLSERPSSHEGSATPLPLDAAVSASSDLTAIAASRSTARSPSPPPPSTTHPSLATRSRSIPPHRLSPRDHSTRRPTDQLIGRSPSCIGSGLAVHPAARSLPLTTLHLASP